MRPDDPEVAIAIRDGWSADEAPRFVAWCRAVSREIDRITGGLVTSRDDLPDADYADAFRSNVPPRDMAIEVLQAADAPMADMPGLTDDERLSFN